MDGRTGGGEAGTDTGVTRATGTAGGAAPGGAAFWKYSSRPGAYPGSSGPTISTGPSSSSSKEMASTPSLSAR